MLRWHVISAVFWRNVKQYFSGVLGYLFIVVFVTVCAVMAFSPQFFADNLANLDQLSRWFPILLLFFVPAVTMGVWADEKRQGTDAILFTLPASDSEILLGKYLSVAAVYTIALLFSMTQLIALKLIGNPDWGVIAGTYLGYWIAGLALLSVGMFASSLTNSATVAFVLGAIFCAVPVMVGYYFRGFVELERWGVAWNLQDFTNGLIPISNVIYFVTLTIFMLYLNLIVISRRHWNRGQQVTLGGHFLVRVVAFGIGLIALVYMVDVAGSFLLTRADLTREKLYTLGPTTIETIENARDAERPVTIQAFVSKQVPRKYVNTKKQFLGLLRQYAMNGGNSFNVEFIDVEPNSVQEKNAKSLGIKPVDDRSEVGGRSVSQKVYLGAHVSSTGGDVTLPFLNEDSAIEYELSRAIASTTDRDSRITLGIVETDAHFAGPEFDGRRLDWAYLRTLNQLKAQFEIKIIPQSELSDYVPATPAAEQATGEDAGADTAPKTKTPPDVLLVADPASLDTGGMNSLISYIQAGNPTLILADPLPFFWAYQNPTGLGVLNAPRQPRVSMRSPYRQILTSSQQPKDTNGTAERLLQAIGVEWDNGRAGWNLFNPHPSFEGHWPDYLGQSWPEYYGPYEKAFVWLRDHGETRHFNPDSTISAGLKEIVLFYPGVVSKAESSQFEFEPLIQLGSKSGVTEWEFLTETPKRTMRRIDRSTGEVTTEDRAARSQITTEDLIVVNPNPQGAIDDQDHAVAARIRDSESGMDVVFITDTDFVTDLFYQQQEQLGEPLDNLVLLQNAIEVLAGDEGFVALRNRRPTPRTLTQVESRIEEFREERARQQEAAEAENRRLLEEEQQKLDEATQEIQQDESLSMVEKLQKTFSSASDAQRKYDLQKIKRDRDLTEKIDDLKSAEQQKISSLESRIRYLAIFLAPLPAFLLGILVLTTRSFNERRHISDARRVHG